MKPPKKFIIDIETERLVKPEHIWVVVCKDVDTGELIIFKNITEDVDECKRCRTFIEGTLGGGGLYIGHNIITFDWPVLVSALKFHSEVCSPVCLDTLIVSRLANFSRPEGHSLESYGEEFHLPKGIPDDYYTLSTTSGTTLGDHREELKYLKEELKVTLGKPKEELKVSLGNHKVKHSLNHYITPKEDTAKVVLPKDLFKCYSKELESYCVRDVEITYKVYLKYLKLINYYNSLSLNPLLLEHKFQGILNEVSNNGFKFNLKSANSILKEVLESLSKLDVDILLSNQPKEVLIREFTPKLTKFGTISRTSVPRSLHPNIHQYEAGRTYRHTRLVPFNPASHKQVIEVLNAAGWKPEDRTTTFINTEREFNIARRKRLPLEELKVKLDKFKTYGWKINEHNLATLPEDAPKSASTLARRILLESRRRTLVEWIKLCGDDGRIHGVLQGIGAWTHRTASQKPNMQNIPNEFDTEGRVKLLGKEFRKLWCVPRNRLLVGVDAEGIQLRVFAHYVNDAELTESLVKGKKSNGTDPHSLNKRILGSVCQTRAAAKRFLYAFFLGAGLSKLASVLATSEDETRRALDRIMERYPGFADLKAAIIPADAKRGWFVGLDGRKVAIPGETASERQHLAMSGYLQNGEKVIMARATVKFYPILKECNALLVDLIHDEWQTETPNNMEIALRVAEAKAKALEEVGQELNLNCPLAGSYWNDDHNDYTIGTNWYQTH